MRSFTALAAIWKTGSRNAGQPSQTAYRDTLGGAVQSRGSELEGDDVLDLASGNPFAGQPTGPSEYIASRHSSSAGRRKRSGSAGAFVQQAVECGAVLFHCTHADAGNRQQFRRGLRTADHHRLERLIGEHAEGRYAVAPGFGQPPFA